MGIAKDELDLIKKLEQDVAKAFRKTAGRQAILLDLGKKYRKLEAELKENDPVDAVLESAEYAKLEIRKDKNWLHEIQSLVADEYRAAQKKSKKRIKDGVVNLSRFTPDMKKEWLTKFVVEFPEDVITTTHLKKALAKIGVTQNAKTWLGPCKLAEKCWSDIKKGNKRLGQYFHWDKVSWLNDAVAESQQ